ncbi:uncharacterized protein LOC100891115 [Strongylocentrotus purpuratus]|uniref:Uncharacterized protein n=1 Tax=Strongylocentrotus purpuratus TaxID=7668 RepID=A0A7M7GLF2_STRPU|nr:uncharacterized protein LOC100891115 [Strongylocentrotus purpuratus]
MAGPTPSQQARVMMWSTPRSISSVFCKCMSFVPDIDIFFDTYVFASEAELNLTTIGKVVDHDADSLGDDDWRKAAGMICEEDCSGDRIKLDMLKYPSVKSMLDNPEPNKRVIFYKGTKTLDSKHFRFLPDKSSNYKHSFLLRHPAKVYSSWKKVIYAVLKDVGDGTGKKITKSLQDFDLRRDVPEKYNLTASLPYKELHDFWVHVRENLDPSPVVMESDDLLADPAGMLSKYCKAVGIPYNDSLLSWDANADITDIWKCAFMPVKDFEFIRIFCHNAFHTSHFLPPPPIPSMDDLPDDVRASVETSMPYYNAMYQTRLLS